MKPVAYLALATIIAGTPIGVAAQDASIAANKASPDARAEKLVKAMTRDEKLRLVRTYFPPLAKTDIKMIPSAGHMPGVPRLGIPTLRESDASLGVANQIEQRKGDVATALPAGLATAATFDPAIAYVGGAMIGAEARAKTFNVLLAGGVNLTRDPWNGRNFEYLGEDPLLAGTLAGEAIRGVESNHIVSTIKHFALNAQETGRMVLDARIGEAALRESDLLAFQIAIERGKPGSVMCAYNKLNGDWACENDFLLNKVLKSDWGYKGWVMSDWGAVHSTEKAALTGLDQESGQELDKQIFFAQPFADAVAAGRIPETRLDDMVRRILHGVIASGLIDDPVPATPQPIDYAAHAQVAQRTAEQGIVLLKNAGDLLPLAKTARNIVLIGAHADVGVLSGGGSSQVRSVGGAPVEIPLTSGAAASFARVTWHASSPLKAIQAALPGASVTYVDGLDTRAAAAAARAADLAIVFAWQWQTEAQDAETLVLPADQDALIDAVAAANARTLVVLETGGPVLMPWIDRVPAILQAWYPGQRGGEAIANILTGAVNPSGRLPITFPASAGQAPRAAPAGLAAMKAADAAKAPLASFPIDYREGADVGYRWYAKTNKKPLFPFGYGLSYTQFRYDNLRVTAGKTLSVSFDVTNTGKTAGEDVPQLYVQPPGGMARLGGFMKLRLAPGAKQRVTIAAEPRSIARYDVAARAWRQDAGSYGVVIGRFAGDRSLGGTAKLEAGRNDAVKHPIALGAAAIALLAAGLPAQTETPAATAHPDLWPALKAIPRDPAIEQRIDALMARMSVRDKVGQMIQVDIGSIKPVDVETWKIGSILNGGNSGPYDDEFAPPAKWLKLADEFYDASIKRSDGAPRIPIIWGTDAVHGNNNIVGATLFPHNIGLGAARDRDLMRRIGEVTAIETAAAGLDWTFAPTLAVVQDDRWGRTYESYSEEPQIQADYAGAVIEGVQGKLGTKDFLAPDHLIATTKHFLGDGGTGGRDQGDTHVPETVLRDVHLGGYPAAIEAGTQSVMVSFSSWNGIKMSGNESLLTGVLKNRMNFDGFVIGDWNSHGQVPGCTNESCAAAINAGMDMFMYSGPDWKKLYENTLTQVESGMIPTARLDDAVRRILRVKLRAGTFDRGRPSSRAFAAKFESVGSPEHRAVARQAVRESLVLLKNEGVLPLKPSARVLVAGSGADNIPQQAGGWTITWQGTGVANKDFPHAQSIWSGIDAAVKAGGGTATLSAVGSFQVKPDAAIVVFGEQPYAEFKGDRPNLDYSPDDKSDLAMLRRLKAAGVPVVAVFLSGRPLWVNAEINASDAFVAAFLPGSEGGGVADLLFRKPGGAAAYDFRGKLSFSWPKRPDQYMLNRRDPGYDPLFAFGYGLSYAKPGHVGTLDETRPTSLASASAGSFFVRGKLPDGWSMTSSAPSALIIKSVDRRAQEDARLLAWTGPANLRITSPKPLDLDRETNGELSLVMEYRVEQAPQGPVTLGVVSGVAHAVSVSIGDAVRSAPTGEWTTLAVPLKCFAAKGADMTAITAPFMVSAKRATIAVSDVRLDYVSIPMTKCGDR